MRVIPNIISINAFILFIIYSTVFLVREYGKYWTKPVSLENRSIEALKKAIIKKMRPRCSNCAVFDVYDKYDRKHKINTSDAIMDLADYSELEAIILLVDIKRPLELWMIILGVVLLLILLSAIMIKVVRNRRTANRE